MNRRNWAILAILFGIFSSPSFCQDDYDYEDPPSDAPAPLPLLSGQVSTGLASCAIQTDFTLWCFGPNSNGQLGVGVPVQQYNSPAMVVDKGPWLSVSQANSLTCGLKTDGSPWCWGDLSFGSGVPNDALEPQILNNVTAAWSSLSVGGAKYVCGVATDGQAYCLGSNSAGQLGDGTMNPSEVPVLVPAPPLPPPPPPPPVFVPAPAPAPSSEDYEEDYSDYSEEQKNNNSDYSEEEQQQNSEEDYNKDEDYSAQDEYSSDQQQQQEQEYDNADSEYGADEQQQSQDSAAYAADDQYQSDQQEEAYDVADTAPTTDGQIQQRRRRLLQSNSHNPRRSLKSISSHSRKLHQEEADVNATAAAPVDPNTTDSVPEATIPPPTGVEDPAATPGDLVAAAPLPPATWQYLSASSSDHTCGLTSDGRIYCWGDNSQGQMGDGTQDGPKLAPVQITATNLTEYISVSSGPFYGCGVAKNGTLVCWGLHPGRLAAAEKEYSDPTPALVPETVKMSTKGSSGKAAAAAAYGNWTSISSGATHACGLQGDTGVYCFGLGANGVLGTKKNASSATPVLVPSTAYTWLSLEAGVNHTCGIQQDGGMYCWGAGYNGALGNGQEKSSGVPVQVQKAAGAVQWGVAVGTQLPETPARPSPPPAPVSEDAVAPAPSGEEASSEGSSVSAGVVAGATAAGMLAIFGAVAGGYVWHRRRVAASHSLDKASESLTGSDKLSPRDDCEAPGLGSHTSSLKSMSPTGKSAVDLSVPMTPPTGPPLPRSNSVNLKAPPSTPFGSNQRLVLPEADRLALSVASKDALTRWLSQLEPSPGLVVLRWAKAWLATPLGSAPTPPLATAAKKEHASLGPWEFTWGDFEPLQSLGMGSFGEVFLARWKEGKEKQPGQQMTALKLLVDAKSIVAQAAQAREQHGSGNLSPAGSSVLLSSRRGSDVASLADQLSPRVLTESGSMNLLASPGGRNNSSGSIFAEFSRSASQADLQTQLNSSSPVELSPRFDELVASAPSIAVVPREDLLRESNLISTINHPNIVQFQGICLRPPALAFEFCPRGSVCDILHAAAKGALPEQLTWHRTLQMAHGAAQGMLYLHSRSPKLIHGDLKSSNLLISEDWTVRIADFRLSKLAEAAVSGNDSALAATGGASNPRWLAPELMEGRKPTTATDSFAFGVILWELMTWQSPPWANLNPWSIVGLVLSGARPLLPSAEALPAMQGDRPGLDGYVSLLQRCWAQRAADRPGFNEISKQLAGLLSQAAL